MKNFTSENLININSTDVPSGTLAIKIGNQVFTPINQGGGIDTSDANAEPSSIITGYSAYVNGSKVTGTLGTSTPTTSNNVVTIPSGYIATEQTVTVGTALAATTYTPTTTDQTIPVGKYTTGVQTIQGDANLVAANIVNGVTIFGVTGTASGGGGSGAGSTTVLSMLLSGNFNVTGPMQYALMYPYTINAEDGDMGGSPSIWAGNFVSDTVGGVSTQVLEWPDQDNVEEPWEFNNYWLQIPFDIYNFLNTETEWTIECWFCPGSVWNTGSHSITFGSDKYGGDLFCFDYYSNFGMQLQICGSHTNRTQLTAGTWYHLAATLKNGVVTFWINGTVSGTFNMPSLSGHSYSANSILFCGYSGSGDYRKMKMSQIKISTEALYTVS